MFTGAMYRLVPELDAIELPTVITRAERSQHAASLDELLEIMIATLTMASVRKTGGLPALRRVANATTIAIAVAAVPPAALPSVMRFEGNFVRRMLRIWDEHTLRQPEDASTYLHATKDEYIVGIGSRDLLDAIEKEDDAAVLLGFDGAERVIGVWHGPA